MTQYRWYRDGRMIVKSEDEDREDIFGITKEYFDDYISIKRHHNGILNLEGVNITSLGNLKSVGGYLALSHTGMTSLDNIEHVGSVLILNETNLTNLGKLERVDGDVYCNVGTTTYDLLMNSKFKDKIRLV